MKRLGERHHPKPIHAFVATPAYDGRVYTDYALSLAQSCQIATAEGIMVTCGLMANGAFIDLARNDFVTRFLAKENATHLFFIDADLKWESSAFIALLKADLPICAGAYRRRQEKEDYPVRYYAAPDGGIMVEGGWIMANRVPAGFLCIRRDVIEKMVANCCNRGYGQQRRIADGLRELRGSLTEVDDLSKLERAIKFVSNAPATGGLIKVVDDAEMAQLFYTKVNDEDRFMGEDFMFCDDYVAQFGKPIPVWPDLNFVHGGYACNYHQFLERLCEAEDAGKIVTKAHNSVEIDGEVIVTRGRAA